VDHELFECAGRSSHARLSPTCDIRVRLAISFSQGAVWKALISKYIGTIPPTGDAFAAEQSVSSGPLPTTAVSSAMTAKVGAAANDSHLTTPGAAALPSSSQLTALVELL